MAGLPGSIPSLMPAGQDELVRRIADLERKVNEMGASMARVIGHGQAGTYLANFAVPLAATSVASQTILVPPGFTTALVTAIAHANARNTTAVNDYFYVGAAINGVAPAMLLAQVLAGAYGVSAGSATRTVTGLSGGGVITVDAMVHSSFNPFPADGSNLASIDALAIFYR